MNQLAVARVVTGGRPQLSCHPRCEEIPAPEGWRHSTSRLLVAHRVRRAAAELAAGRCRFARLRLPTGCGSAGERRVAAASKASRAGEPLGTVRPVGIAPSEPRPDGPATALAGMARAAGRRPATSPRRTTGTDSRRIGATLLGSRSESSIPALRVHQWLSQWDDVRYDPDARRAEPEHDFLLCSMPVGLLRRLSGIERRSATPGRRRAADDAIQRAHEKRRSKEIRRFIFNGYPWSDLSESRRSSGNYDDLKMPGWLPTAIIVNIVGAGQERRGRKAAESDLIHVDLSEPFASIEFPGEAQSPTWGPTELPPLEIIDGQHRLLAFEPDDDLDFEVPVVAFRDLDISWQAYVFWTVNITPTRINRSLAFDLYPLLRTVDWLDRVEGLTVYREARAQELTELLWAVPESPWFGRINMLGEGRWGVSQAAWIRSLLATFIKAHRGGEAIGGLFGEVVGSSQMVLPWTRPEQAAFLIFGWGLLEQAIAKDDSEWSTTVRHKASPDQLELGTSDRQLDTAFASKQTLLNTDQGVRGFMYLLNDLCFVRADQLGLQDAFAHRADDPPLENDELEVRMALGVLEDSDVRAYVAEICKAISSFDWRTSAAPGLSEEERLLKAAYRGSGGYRILRRSLLAHLARHGDARVSDAAAEVASRLGLE